jgi:RNA polymerase sigma factor (sigma-70 family)
MNGTDLLAEFRRSRSDKAFGELVRRYTNLVYSAARRRLSNDAAAEEATQSVFIRLASTAPELRDDAALVAWLHRTTVHVSIDLWRVESRRRAREEQAAAMQTLADDTAWNEIAPEIDEALNALTDAERQTILLRFFEHKSMRELGAAFGISEDAAKMRVSRALDRLRERVGPKAACGAVALGTMLTNRSVEAAPAALVAALMCVSWPGPAVVSAAAGLGVAFLNVLRVKLTLGAAAIAVTAAVAFLATRSPRTVEIAGVAVAPTVESSLASATQTMAAMDAAPTTASEAATKPDPLQLLLTVARARESAQSGTVELDVQSDHYSDNNDVKITEQKHIVVLFDGPRTRFDSIGPEYSPAPVDWEGAQMKIREQGLDREAAVKAGLLKAFEAHNVSIYDGTAVLHYRESDGRPQGASIHALDDGTGQFMENPQCFGLRHVVWPDSTVRSCLAFEGAKSIKLIGKESVEGTPAWHVQVHSKHDDTVNFWIDAARPERLLKQSYGRDFVLSRYDRSGGPLPRETVTKEFSRNGKLEMETRCVISNIKLGVSLPASTWTLAGLGMKIGTDVSDNRAGRRIGYWNGAGLSENPPPKGAEPETAPEMAELLSLLNDAPGSPQAFEAAHWIFFNMPDGAEVEKAAQAIQQEHLHNTNVVTLCKRLEDVRYRCSTNLLESFLEKNPSAEVRAHACFLLAMLKKEEAAFGKNQKATATAVKLFERVVNEFGKEKKPYARDLARQAKGHLDELQRLQIGMIAPDFDGTGFEGEQISLRDYRGKVVVLAFWCCGYSEAQVHAKFLKEMEGKPVALIGISHDSNPKRAREPFGKYDITWPNIWDKDRGPIATAWNIQHWPDIWVLDGKGVIRFRDVDGSGLVKTVETLLAE